MEEVYLVIMEEWDDGKITASKVVAAFNNLNKATQHCQEFEAHLEFINKDLNSEDEYVMFVKEQKVN